MSSSDRKPPRTTLRPTRAALRQGRAPANATVDAIFERIEAAITEHRLPPGTKLGEEYLCDIFGVSRTKVRQSLFRLADEKLVTVLPRRGAFVAQPGEQEARDVFETRRYVECAIIAKFARIVTSQQIARLGAQHQRERDSIADRTGNTRKERQQAIKELGEYSDADLADLGIARANIEHAVHYGRPGIDQPPREAA